MVTTLIEVNGVEVVLIELLNCVYIKNRETKHSEDPEEISARQRRKSRTNVKGHNASKSRLGDGKLQGFALDVE